MFGCFLAWLADKADVVKRVHPHAFRHTYAVELERAGTPISVISMLLRHSSIAVTARYLAHLTSAEAGAVLDSTDLPPIEYSSGRPDLED